MIRVVTNREEHFRSIGWEQFATIDESLAILDDGEDITILDAETTGLGFMFSRLHCIQLGTIDDEHQFIIDTVSIDPLEYKEFIESRTILGHNILFDMVFLYACDIIPKKVICTYANEFLLTAGLPSHLYPRNFGHVVNKYLGIEVDKAEQSNIAQKGLSDVSTILYSGNDVKHLYRVHKAQEKLLDIHNLLPVADLHYRFIRVVAYMELCGMYLNPKRWTRKIRESEWEEWTQQKALYAYLKENYPELHDMYEDIEWTSSKQVQDLFEDIGIDIVNPKDPEKRTVDIKVLINQAKEFPIIDIYKKFKEANKQVTTYGRDWLTDVVQSDGRVHTKYKLMVDTGRTGSGNSKGHTSFRNMQNLPADEYTRSSFQGKGPNMLIVADYSSQESVILADMSQEPNLLKFYLEGAADLHSYAASLIWQDYSLDEIMGAKKSKDDGEKLTDRQKECLKLRQWAKQANFAIAYGGNGYTVATNLNISPEEGERIYKAYLKAFPGLEKFFNKCRANMWADGHVRVPGPYGWIRFINEFRELKDFKNKKKGKKLSKEEWSKMNKRVMAIERESLNTPCQGMAGMMSKLAGVYFLEEIEKRKWWGKVKIVNFVHDEWVAEAHQKTAPKVGPVLSECMETAASEFLTTLSCRADFVLSKNWEH